MAMLISGATVIDASGRPPVEGHAIWIENGTIRAIGKPSELGCPPGLVTVDARGKHVIPGLMNANVHLLGDTSLENLTHHCDRYEDLIAEAAQVALKSGLTSVFDTWGPRRPLMAVRDRIRKGEVHGSRVFCAGNIVGFDGPFSHDFSAKAAEVASAQLTRRINSIWVENVGRHLMWLTPEEVAREVRAYIAKGIDFLKYAANEHFGYSAGAFLAFSPRVQSAIVDEAHRAGVMAQAHTMTVEGLRSAIEAGSDLIQHANHTGPTLIPEATLELLSKQSTAVVVFPMTEQRLSWLTGHDNYRTSSIWRLADTNVRNLIRCGARMVLGNDAVVPAPATLADPRFEKNWGGSWEGNLFSLAEGHFSWLKAMEEKGCPPMDLLLAATRNVASVYGQGDHLGTLEPGKAADLLILNGNPLESADNYRAIHMIVKDGRVIDRGALPLNPVLTGPLQQLPEEEVFRPFIGGGKFPGCPLCKEH